MPTVFTDNPPPEIAAERDRIMWLISRWQLSPDGAGVRSKCFTAINAGMTPEQCLAKNWGHPFTEAP